MPLFARCCFASFVLAAICAAQPAANSDLRSDLLAATTRHLDALLAQPEQLTNLKGKSASGMTALAAYLAFEATGKDAYRTAAIKIADSVLAAMKATKFGVLYIKEKTRADGEEVAGGGPPALGWYASALAYIYQREGKTAELSYVAGVLDWFPWNEAGWWSADIDVRTGVSKQPLTKPSPINKNAAVAMAAGITAVGLRALDPARSARLAERALRSVEQQIIPAQESDGFWHYGLTGNDPKEKDVLGYFMLTGCELIQGQQLGGLPRESPLASALRKAGEFAEKNIAPITGPNRGATRPTRASRGTPAHYDLAEDTKRGFQLALLLLGAGRRDAGATIARATLAHFPFGDRGQDGAQAVISTALMHLVLKNAASTP
jgi:hypothetical protein